MHRVHAYVLSALLIGASAYPAFINPFDDDYPLSTYPMFSTNRGRLSTVTSAMARGAGIEIAIPPSYVANSEAMQALQTLKKSVRAGKRSTRKLCREIATRVAARNEQDLLPAVEVVILTQRYNSIDYLGGSRVSDKRKVHMKCPIERGPTP